ncbi:chloramphenicol phosphotransferase CPT family protein [Streptomyces odontomachi]|uniref:chloramphenicol phosphotransferase CPT family protein n=1 Tax=Streptomyces odontomachi TaxID=2944940 RepID=UPI00210E6049|nr:AAA family ATPase [Streptomyces sp. ODS25]
MPGGGDHEEPEPADRGGDPAATQTGLIIFLNGTSSSGKSSIARELLQILDAPGPALEPASGPASGPGPGAYFHMPVDAFHALRSRREVSAEALPGVLRRTWMGFHRAVAGMAAAGNNVVVDHVLSEEWRLLDCLRLFSARNVVLVGVRCSLEELRRREQARGDRPPGLAARQFQHVHAHGLYDVTCDTTTATALECARQIRAFLPQRPTPTAFEQLRRKLLPDLPGAGREAVTSRRPGVPPAGP